MEFNLKSKLNEALTLCQQGNLTRAKEIYLQVIKISPINTEALTNLGTIELHLGNVYSGIDLLEQSINFFPRQPNALLNIGNAFLTLGDYEKALNRYEKACLTNPLFADAHFNKGKVLSCLFRLEEAVQSYSRATKIEPNFLEAYNNKGVILNKLGRFEEALESYDSALILNSNYAEAHYNKGVVLNELGRYEKALESYGSALRLNSNYAEAYNNKGVLLNKLERFEEALESYDSALSLNSKYVEAHYNKGVVLNELGRYEEALESYGSALRLNSNYAEAHYNKGVVLNELGRYEEALESYDSALKLNASYADAFNNKGVVLNELGRYEEALKSYDSALTLNTNYAEAHLNRACLKLDRLDFKYAWEDYIWRFKVRSLGLIELSTKKPKWRGSKNTNRLFVWAEQGIGDQILYASMLIDLQKYARKITVSLNKKLIPLFERSFPEINFIDDDIFYSEQNYDEQIALGDLAGYLRADLDTFTANSNRYLKTDSTRSREIQKILEKEDKPICGVSWKSANKKLGNDKSIEFKLFAELLNIKNLKFINLQYGETSSDLTWLKESTNANLESINDIDLYDDIDDVAAIIEACDFIVTISNSVAHLAGALGKETFLLLPYSKGKFWYWSDVNGRSLWYPNVQIFKQSAPSNWSQPLSQVKEYIEKKYAAKN